VRIYLRCLKAWRKAGWKHIWTSDLRDELYNLSEDPHEQKNLIAEAPDKADEMRVEMEDYLVSLPYALRGDKAVTGRVSSEAIARLRALEFFQEIMPGEQRPNP
jgi:hypothetical protein